MTQKIILSPIAYAILGSAATIGLLVGGIAFTAKSKAIQPSSNPIEELKEYRERGSGRIMIDDLLAELKLRIAEQEQKNPTKRKQSRTEIAIAQSEGTTKGPTDPPPGEGPRD